MAITQSRDGLRRGTLARETGCNGETIRYYEKIGLLNAPDRTEGGHRIYSREDQARLGFILRGRELGFSIEELHGLLQLAGTGDYSCAEVLALTRRNLEAVREKIVDLRRLEDRLQDITSQCTGTGGRSCSVMDVLADVRRR